MCGGECGDIVHCSQCIGGEQKKSRGEQLADDHWKYIKSLLKRHNLPDDQLNIIEFHYITAFIHGFKHGQEETDD